jgi:transposase
MILELKRQGLGVRAIARQTGPDRKTVRKYPERGLGAPVHGPKKSGDRLADRFQSDLAERLDAFPGLSVRRLHREIKMLAHCGSAPRACRPYRARTKGPVGRPFRYIRQDVCLGRSLRDMEDLIARFEE